jgi:hypothetical protein
VFHGLALPEFLSRDVRRTPPSWLRWRRSGLPLPTVLSRRLGQCEVSVMIPFNPTSPWSGSIIGSEADTGVDMIHTSPAPLCARTASPVQQHCLSRFSQFRIRRTPYGNSALRPCSISRAITSTHRMTSLARYAQYLFNVQHSTARTAIK